MIEKRLKCKHCGNDDGFYMKCSYKGTYNFNINGYGHEIDNSEMFGNVDSKYTSKFIYCIYCGKKVGKIEELYGE